MVNFKLTAALFAVFTFSTAAQGPQDLNKALADARAQFSKLQRAAFKNMQSKKDTLAGASTNNYFVQGSGNIIDGVQVPSTPIPENLKDKNFLDIPTVSQNKQQQTINVENPNDNFGNNKNNQNTVNIQNKDFSKQSIIKQPIQSDNSTPSIIPTQPSSNPGPTSSNTQQTANLTPPPTNSQQLPDATSKPASQPQSDTAVKPTPQASSAPVQLPTNPASSKPVPPPQPSNKDTKSSASITQQKKQTQSNNQQTIDSSQTSKQPNSEANNAITKKTAQSSNHAATKASTANVSVRNWQNYISLIVALTLLLLIQ